MGNELNCANPFGDHEEEGEDDGPEVPEGTDHELEHTDTGTTQRKQDAAKNGTKSGGRIYRVDVERYDKIKAKEANVTDLSKLSSEGNRFITDL